MKQHATKLRRILFLACLAVGLVAISIMSRTQVWTWTIQVDKLPPPAPAFMPALQLKCQNVTGRMVVGQWVKRNHSQAEQDEIQTFLNRTREVYGIPKTLERPDKRCGNVDYGDLKKKTPTLVWNRALCNPFGSLPCCYDNKCAAKSVAECRCTHCYDMRQQVNAELATWVPSDPTCQMTHFHGEEDTCRILKNLNLVFIGDSFMRQLYISVLALLRSNKQHGVLKETLAPDTIQMCDKYFTYFSKCKAAIIGQSDECNNTVTVRKHAYWRASQAKALLTVIGEFSGRPNSLIVFGIGGHDRYNLGPIQTQILNPMFHLLSKSPWPRVVWMAAHAPGLLRTPLVTTVQPESILRYNARVKAIMDERGIPVLDFYVMSEGMMSYDGVHYGKGVNDVKAQMLLNYILELRSNSALFSEGVET